MYGRLKPISQTLPMLIFHKDKITDVLLSTFFNPDSLAFQEALQYVFVCLLTYFYFNLSSLFYLFS
jgi:hypothetical protein